MKKHLWIIGLGLLGLSAPNLGHADELTRPTLSVNDVFFQETFKAIEGGTGGFDSPQWRLGAHSQFAPWVEGQVSVGSSDLIARPRWSSGPNESVMLYEAKATLHSLLGDVYAGQFAVPWGLEGTTDYEYRWFPPSFLYQQGYFPLVDLGAGFKTELDGYFMNVAVHNGEGGMLPNADNRVLLTGQWGLRGPAHMVAGLSATAGRFAGTYFGNETRLRGGNAFFGFHIFGLGFQIEGSLFQMQNLTTNTTTDSLVWHGDAQLPVIENINLIGRYEQINPNTRASNVNGRGYLGCEYHSKSNVSRLFLLFVKNTESPQESPNDEIRLVWRLSPFSDDF